MRIALTSRLTSGILRSFTEFRFRVKRDLTYTNMSSGRHMTLGSTPPPLVKGKLRLYSMRFCPFAHRVTLVLEAKKIPYDVVFINLTEPPEWLTEKSPFRKVPCLELENGKVVYESLILAEYVDSFPGRQVCNPDPLQHALDKILVEQFNNVIGAYYKVYTDFQNLNAGDVLAALDYFEEELIKRGTPFFGGACPGWVDYMIWPWCERADMLTVLAGDDFEMSKDRFPKLLEWKRGMVQDDAVKAYFLDAQTHAKFFRSREGGAMPAYDMLLDDA